MKIISPLQRQNLIPLHLKFIRLLISLFIRKKKYLNQSLAKIEKFSYSILEFPAQIKLWDVDTRNLISNLISNSEETNEFDYSIKKPFYYIRKIKKNSEGLVSGYDLNMIEFCNIDTLLANNLGETYGEIKDVAQSVCSQLVRIRKKKLSIKYIKLYHYNSVEHPRPLHFDSNHNDSYKIFFFLDDIKEENGPYCVIPSTHNNIINKLMRIYNLSKLNKIWPDQTDGSFYKSSDSIKFKQIKENNFIVTKQNAIHGDIPAKRNFNKTALVFHILRA
tara:strand:- start:303 stop:1130 length:828 start_codon:yes stop_codon:yes gene_type:complete